MTESSIAELLDELTPSYDDRRGDWDRVAVSAGRRGNRNLARIGVVAAAVAGACVLVLAWPFHGEQGSLLERARAAIGDGPVLHVVLRGEWGGRLVNIRNGEDGGAVYGDDEYWYDTRDGRVHWVERLGDSILNEQVSRPEHLSRELEALGRDYRHALETGAARVSGEGTIDGERVAWVIIHRELLPDVADGKDHEFTEQVAVSKETFEPVALRATRDGGQLRGTLQRVLGLEFLPVGAGDFTAPPPLSLDGQLFSQGREPISLEQARVTLGRTPLWLGREYEGLPLAAVYRQTTSTGRRRGVNTEGPITWSEEQVDVVLFYGTVGDDPTTYRGDAVPQFDEPHVTVTESTKASPYRRIAGSYVPPAGSMFVAVDGAGYLHVDGLHAAIEGRDDGALLAAARALEPMTP